MLDAVDRGRETQSGRVAAVAPRRGEVEVLPARRVAGELESAAAVDEGADVDDVLDGAGAGAGSGMRLFPRPPSSQMSGWSPLDGGSEEPRRPRGRF